MNCGWNIVQKLDLDKISFLIINYSIFIGVTLKFGYMSMICFQLHQTLIILKKNTSNFSKWWTLTVLHCTLIFFFIRNWKTKILSLCQKNINFKNSSKLTYVRLQSYVHLYKKEQSTWKSKPGKQGIFKFLHQIPIRNKIFYLFNTEMIIRYYFCSICC